MNKSRSCNCKRTDQCPLEGNCQARSIAYKATVNNGEGTKQYIGFTENTIEQRYSSYLQSMRHEKYESSTELSKYVWRSKRSSKDTDIKWSIHKRVPANFKSTKKCKLCLSEKLAIVSAERTTGLIKRSEMISKCRHEYKFYLSPYSRPCILSRQISPFFEPHFFTHTSMFFAHLMLPFVYNSLRYVQQC